MPDEESEAHPQGGTTEERAHHMRELDKARRSRLAKLIAAAILIGLMIAFVIQNYSEFANVHYVFVERRSRLFWVFVVSGVIGLLIGYLLARPTKAQRKFIKDAEKNLPRGDR